MFSCRAWGSFSQILVKKFERLIPSLFFCESQVESYSQNKAFTARSLTMVLILFYHWTDPDSIELSTPKVKPWHGKFGPAFWRFSYNICDFVPYKGPPPPGIFIKPILSIFLLIPLSPHISSSKKSWTVLQNCRGRVYDLWQIDTPMAQI
jgi:hypothetical protein